MNFEDILGLLIPIFICVVLPVSIVAIYNFTKLRRQRNRSDVAMKAIENGVDVDLTKLMGEEKSADNTTPMQQYLRNLKVGLVLLAIGIAFLIFWIYMASTYSIAEEYAPLMLISLIGILTGAGILIVARVIKRNIRESDTEE